MIRAGSVRLTAAFAAAIMGSVWTTPPALAISPPGVDPGVQPPSGAPGPGQPMEQRGPCGSS